MNGKYDIYKCESCESLLMSLFMGEGTLECCGKPMVRLPEQTADSSTEKHVPIIKKVDGGYDVIVGSTLHPMGEKHWIQWIELVADGKRTIVELTPNDEPIAKFRGSCASATKISAREYCNLHGLWKGEVS